MKPSIRFYRTIFLSAALFLFTKAEAQMYWDQAAIFAGNSSSYVSVPNSPSLDITGSFTLEALINPSVLTGASKGIISKGGLLGTSLKYGIRLNTNGTISVLVNGSPKIVSTFSNLITVNNWTHIAATFNSSSGTYKIYINGNLDTSAVPGGTLPTANSDSLYIGISGTSTPFKGKLDEVRVWDTELSAVQISGFMKSSLGTSGNNLFNNLVLSLPFQNNLGTTPYLSFMDYSSFSNNGSARNITALDLKESPSRIHQFNDCAFFYNSGGFFSALDNSSISPTNKITIELWVYPKLSTCGLVFKGNLSAFSPDYGLNLISGKLNASINNISIPSNDSVKTERWSHIAFTYFGATGVYEFYVNGKRGTTGSIIPANINDGPDSLLIGAYPPLQRMSGLIDEFRISNTVKSAAEINSQMFTSINESNDDDSYNTVAYNFDANGVPSTDNSPRLKSWDFVAFTFNGASTFGITQSPINNFLSGDLNRGYYMSMPNRRIPETGSSGTIYDTIEILSAETINDINVYVALDHSKENSLTISLKSPLGITIDLFDQIQLSDFASNIVTVFDSDADSSLISGRYINFGPKIKPLTDLDAVFSGDNAKGKWVLKITDNQSSDTGFITAWGLQINNAPAIPFKLESTVLPEGFYDQALNSLNPDTVRFYLYNTNILLIDSSKALLNDQGKASVSFTKAQPLTDYFLVVRHRNSIETWSSSVIKFTQFTKQASYNFSDLQTRAFGNNLVQADSDPLRFALYGGDVNQDDIVDVTDGSMVDNDAFNFISGYIQTDVNGDGLADVSDAALVDNNAANFVGAVIP